MYVCIYNNILDLLFVLFMGGLIEHTRGLRVQWMVIFIDTRILTSGFRYFSGVAFQFIPDGYLVNNY